MIITKQEILRTLEQLREKIMQSYKVKRIGLFGSLVKGEQRKGSDIDILVEFNDDADLFDFLGLTLFLEERFKQKVDVVPQEDLRQEIRGTVLKEVVYL